MLSSSTKQNHYSKSRTKKGSFVINPKRRKSRTAKNNGRKPTTLFAEFSLHYSSSSWLRLLFFFFHVSKSMVCFLRYCNLRTCPLLLSSPNPLFPHKHSPPKSYHERLGLSHSLASPLRHHLLIPQSKQQHQR